VFALHFKQRKIVRSCSQADYKEEEEEEEEG
jgi:hypothetical protein